MSDRVPSLQELIRRRQAGGFVGRREQLGTFEANLGLSAGDARRRFLFCLHGSAGVGKTFLVRQFARAARERGVLTAYVDESAYDVVTAVETVVGELAGQGARCREFPGLMEEYRQRRHELESDPETPEEVSSALTRTAVRVGLRLAGDLPLVGAVAEEVDPEAVARRLDRARAFLGRRFRSPEDVRLLLSPVEVLTAAFVRDLAAIAEVRPVALFFDTYERTGVFLETWLLDLLAGRYGDLPGSLLLTVAGQAPLDANRWGDYLPVRTDFPLEVFTDAEARQLLSAHGVTDSRVVETVLELSGRLPVWVATLASARPGDAGGVGDPSGDAVERFLKWEQDPLRRAAALRGALPRTLDRDVFALVDGDSQERFDWLRRLPFVVEHPDGYRYHDVVRSAMLRVLRRNSTADWTRHHRTLAGHYRAARDALDLTGRDAPKNQTWQQLAIQECYHDLCARGTAALPVALGGLVDAIAWHPSLATSWTEAITHAGRDSANPELNRHLDDLPPVPQDDTPPTDLLTALIGHHQLDPAHKATALAERGEIHRLTGRYKEALADFDRAIQLDPKSTWPIASRGQTYQSLERYEEAMADFDRAIELDPKYAWAIARRGLNYQFLGRYEEALADFDRAIELNSKSTWPITSRGQTYQSLERYEEALTDFDRAIELNPKSTWTITSRGLTYQSLGRYEEALTDFDRAIELDPRYAWAIASRGLTYQSLGRYEEALTNFDRAIELDPEYAWAIASRGETFRLMGRYEEALADFDRAIELDPKSTWPITSRGQAYRSLGRYEEALADLKQAVSLDPHDDWARYELALTLMVNGRVDEANEELKTAMELSCESMPHAGVAKFNAIIYEIALGHKSVALEKLTEMLNAEPSTSPTAINAAIVDMNELGNAMQWDLSEFVETLTRKLQS